MLRPLSAALVGLGLGLDMTCIHAKAQRHQAQPKRSGKNHGGDASI